MLRAVTVIRKAAVKEDRIADTAWLDHHARHREQGVVRSHGGLEFILSLDGAERLNDGDAVKLEDGRLVQVRAAPERLLEIRAENPARLLRLAWHLGQRHTEAEITAEAIYIGDDPALAELARGQGCRVTPVMRPFHPERVDENLCAHHDHGHAPDRHDAHGHGHHHGHADAHAQAGHQHGPACGHGHGERHEH
jgi:urease accessory protein